MEAKELRIGNLVNWEGVHKIEDAEDLWDAHMLKPIPLTEEWLLKFGFDKYGMAYTKFSFIINKWTDGELMYGYIGGNFEIKYVHQLQNLYFALTGEELNIFIDLNNV